MRYAAAIEAAPFFLAAPPPLRRAQAEA